MHARMNWFISAGQKQRTNESLHNSNIRNHSQTAVAMGQLCIEASNNASWYLLRLTIHLTSDWYQWYLSRERDGFARTA